MDKKLILVCLAATAALLLMRDIVVMVDDDAGGGEWSPDGDDETVFETIGQAMDQVIGSVAPGPVAGMSASDDVRRMLKNREQLRLERYNLGDGGWTIGYGHFEKNINNIPARITRDDAERMFEVDIVERAEKWVRLYVSVPLTQHEYDAMVHIAYNLSPKSFKKFADGVNAGQGIGYMAERSISWVAAKFTNGIRNRRNEELMLFNQGVYA